MCYLLAKKFDGEGCIALKTKHGKELSRFVKKIQGQIGETGIQIVTISRPSAYGEYEPYEIVDSKDEFEERIIRMQ